MSKLSLSIEQRKALLFKITVTAILSALGTVIMVVSGYIPFLRYWLGPWLVMEPSDTVVMVTYLICGWPYAIVCAVLKALINLMFLGPSGPYGIGQITAIITSLVYVLGIFLMKLIFKNYDAFWKRVVMYVAVVVMVAITMTLLNYLFITPTYLSGKFDSCFNPQYQGDSIKLGQFSGFLIVVCILLYLPFNALKGVIVVVLFELLYLALVPLVKKLFPYVKI